MSKDVNVIESFAHLLTPIQITILNVVCQQQTLPKLKEVAELTRYSLETVRQAMVSKNFKEAYRHIFLASSFASAGAVVEKLGEKALDGNMTAIKLYLQLHGLIRDPKEQEQDLVGSKEKDAATIVERRKKLEEEYKKIVKDELGANQGEIRDVNFEVEEEKKVGFSE